MSEGRVRDESTLLPEIELGTPDDVGDGFPRAAETLFAWNLTNSLGAKLLDDTGKALVIRKTPRRLFGVFERAADISSLAAEIDECRQGIAIGRMPYQ